MTKCEVCLDFCDGGLCWRCAYKAKKRSEHRRTLSCERCLQPIDYGALCRICDPDNEGLFEENVDRWTV